MEDKKTLIREKLLEWDRILDEYQLPRWDDFPLLPLYMDQVIYLLNQYLCLPLEGGEQKGVTPAMINNYVKLGIIPRPVKKRYGRAHLAYLVLVCTLKQTINTGEIKKLIPSTLKEDEIKALYEEYAAVYRQCKTDFREKAGKAAAPVFSANGPGVAHLVFQAAVFSGLSQMLAEQILTLYPETEEKNKPNGA